MRSKVSNVAGPGHGLVQRYISMQSKKQCPKGWRVKIDEEYSFQEGKFRPDVFVQYFKVGKQFKIIYEVQDRMGEKTFQKKIKIMTRMIIEHEPFTDQFIGHRVHDLIVIKLENVPPTWEEAFKWIGERVVTP